MRRLYRSSKILSSSKIERCLINSLLDLAQCLNLLELKKGEPAELTLRLQPVGTERLGDWDKLAGVVFGCSTREGRRICALPGIREKMDEFAQRFREAKSRSDPALLAEAYAVVADAFEGVGDADEASKWRERAAAQARLARPLQD